MDHVLDYMKKNNLPLTREKYLEMAYLGNPPAELDAEEEAELPREFQKNPTEYVDPDNED
jgi:hypothetical protein